MRTVICQCILATALGCTVICSAGCTTDRSVSDSPSLWQKNGFYAPISDSLFVSTEAAFKYIAQREGLATDRQTLFTLAADSTLERSHSPATGYWVIVYPEYFGQSQFGIRGAQGQGRYYAYQTRDTGWKLVGIFEGNGYRWDVADNKLRIITRWHISASESPETIYTWNGKIFE